MLLKHSQPAQIRLADLGSSAVPSTPAVEQARTEGKQVATSEAYYVQLDELCK
jgi:hypothetical protein